ncbi:substrate-binding domain-containing protein [Aurantibacter sp.]|uniref:substrate-binding domain-containing protein n=1 Tax=Aurantibacter sp. TaxID=2807103 RepID=UPI003264F462
MDKSRRTTIQDIAKFVNVSIGTVDRVIHNRGNVSPDKKKKILEAIKILNFNPNFLASTLALGKQRHICSLLPCPASKNSFWQLPKKGVEQTAVEYKDFGITYTAFDYDLNKESSFIEKTSAVLDANPDGVILAPLFREESLLFIKKLEEKQIPYVFIDSFLPEQKNLSYIGPDLKGGGYVAAKLMSSILKPSDDILIVNLIKSVKNSNLDIIEKGFREYFGSTANERNIKSITIPSIDERDINIELTKYYLKNLDTKGVFVTNSKASLIAKYHNIHELPVKMIGFDLLEENIKEMKNGTIDYLISQRPFFQGSMAVKALFHFFIYKKIPSKLQLVPLDIIIKETVDYYMDFKEPTVGNFLSKN